MPHQRTSWAGRILLLLVTVLCALPVVHIFRELALSHDEPDVVLRRVADDVATFLQAAVPEVSF